MLVPLEWLSEYVDHGLTTDELAWRLTMIGLNVEGIHRPAAGWHDVFVGHIVALEPHPRSRNPLNVARVDLGDQAVTIVTGAPNVRLGDKVPTVLIGGRLPHGPGGEPMTIESKPMAGIVSEGMLCSARELGISDEHSGIYILPSDAPVGAPLGSVMGGDVLDVETVSNRPDTLSMIGIAREVAAATQQQLNLPAQPDSPQRIEWLPSDSTTLRIEVPELCPRFSAVKIEGAHAGESPAWLASRLTAAGQRPINLLVDLTNYVMLEMGQPMHAFDADRLTGEGIVVRRAVDGETLRTLDGVERTLTGDAVVVADGSRAVSLAGIIGGEESEITSETTTLLLEAATWVGPNIRATAKAHGIRTEASHRFERGQPPEATVPALLRFVELLSTLNAHPIRVSQVVDARADIPVETVVGMPLRDLDRLVGVPIDAETAAEHLSLLGFRVTLHDDRLDAVVPPWRRVDIEQSADLVEEVARAVGFDGLPATLPRRTMRPPRPDPAAAWKAALRDRLLSGGVTEITTHSLTSPASMERLLPADSPGRGLATSDWSACIPNPLGVRERRASLEFVRLQNPASADRQVLRMSLLPSVLDVLTRNMRQTDERLSFFELDRTFFRRDEDLPYERETLAVALSGLRAPRSWANPQPGTFTFFDMKGLLAALLHEFQVRAWSVEPRNHPSLHPGRSAALLVDGHEMALFGELHPDVALNFEVSNFPVQVAEVDLDALIARASDVRVFSPLPRFPAAYRDIAAVVARDLPVSRLLELVEREGGADLESARIFDVYEGSQLPPDKKSVAIELAFRSPESTLTQDEVSAAMATIIESMRRELSATLRD